MKRLFSAFFALLFAATLVLSGCTASLTGPTPDQAPDKTVQTDRSFDEPAMRNDANGSGQGASHNTTKE